MGLRSTGASIESGFTTFFISIAALVACSKSIGGGYYAGMSISSLISKMCGVSLSSLSAPGSSTFFSYSTPGISISTSSGSNVVLVSGGTPGI